MGQSYDTMSNEGPESDPSLILLSDTYLLRYRQYNFDNARSAHRYLYYNFWNILSTRVPKISLVCSKKTFPIKAIFGKISHYILYCKLNKIQLQFRATLAFLIRKCFFYVIVFIFYSPLKLP